MYRFSYFLVDYFFLFPVKKFVHIRGISIGIIRPPRLHRLFFFFIRNSQQATGCTPAVERRSRAIPSTRIRRFFLELASNRHAEKLQRISRPAVIYAARVHDIPTLYGARHPLNVKWERGHSPGNVLDFPSLRCIRREFFHLAASRWLPTVLRPWAYGASYKTALPRRNARKLAK